MDGEKARQTWVENLTRSPEKLERQLDALYANPHFGDVVTEVFPEVLDPHDEHGRDTLRKYAELAAFLEETKDAEDAAFAVVRIETRNIEYHVEHPKKSAEAVSVRYLKNARAENFEIARDENGAPIGIAIAQPVYTEAHGWKGEDIQAIQPYAIIDSATRQSSWGGPYNELESGSQFMFGTSQEVYRKAQQLDYQLRLISMPVSGYLFDIQTEIFRTDAGLESKRYEAVGA